MSRLTRSSSGIVPVIGIFILVLIVVVGLFLLVTWGAWAALVAIAAGNLGFWQVAMLGIALAYYVGIGTSVRK